MASVAVVVCMDTEGPCAEPGNSELLPTWEDVDRAMDRLFDPAFRARVPDRGGGELRIGWFFLTWTGFTTNPRRRAFGYHAVRDHYLDRWGARIAACRDEQCWHYHHPPASGVANEWGLDWSVGEEHDAIVSRQLLERDWFPVCFRAGGTILDERASRWVDCWFPFDYSNRAPLRVPGLVDWSKGVAEWAPYQPDPEDFRRPGPGRRRLFRCLDLSTGIHTLGADDVRQAFEEARSGAPAVLACFDHDYRDIADRLDRFRRLVRDIGAEYADVEWRYAAPVEAARLALGAPGQRGLVLEAGVAADGVHVWSSEPLFQSFPWLAVRTPGGQVEHVEDGLLRLDAMRWLWRPSLQWVEAAFGGSTDLGEAAVCGIRPDDGPGSVFVRSRTEQHPRHPRSIWEHSTRYTQSAVTRSAGGEPELDSAAQARELLRAHLQAGMSVLDVGSGAGHLWRSVRDLGLEYHGIDSYRRAVEIGRATLAAEGLPPSRLRDLAIEDLPPGESYDAVVSLSTLLYAPDFRLPLEAMASAARRLVLVRSSFGDETAVRYLPDVLLDEGFETLRAYFSVFSRRDVESFLREEGFARVDWIEDRRQRERFGGEPEVVGGIALPYEFMLAERD